VHWCLVQGAVCPSLHSLDAVAEKVQHQLQGVFWVHWTMQMLPCWFLVSGYD
jgi:hypothetical protein